jgi:hypothetical protein
MAKIDSAWATDFIKASFAAIDINFSDQSVSFFPNLSFIGWNIDAFILPSGVGNPNYFSSKVL